MNLEDLITSPKEVQAVSTNLLSAPKPVMSEAVESDVLDALSQYQNRDKWKLWGMHLLREQGSAILLKGPSGTGKTTIARWMAKKIKRGFLKLSVADLGGGEPGESERRVQEFFANARKRHNATIFMDECDMLLGDRSEIGAEGRTWQLGTTETLMMEMNVYGGLLIAATNHADSLDPALSNRFLAIVEVGEPDFSMREKLWRLKLPKQFPFKPSTAEFKRLAQYELNGRQIENVIVAVASHAMRKSVRPTLTMFKQYCEREKGKHIEKK